MTPQQFFLNFIILITFCSFVCGEEKSSKDIQKDINSRKSELQSLRNEIKDIEERLIRKNREAINTSEVLLDLENKISLTEKLIRSLNKEEQYISNLIIKMRFKFFTIRVCQFTVFYVPYKCIC